MRKRGNCAQWVSGALEHPSETPLPGTQRRGLLSISDALHPPALPSTFNRRLFAPAGAWSCDCRRLVSPLLSLGRANQVECQVRRFRASLLWSDTTSLSLFPSPQSPFVRFRVTLTRYLCFSNATMIMKLVLFSSLVA